MNFEQLTYQIKDKLYRFSLRITGNAPEAQDVVQEVFIKIWEKRDDMADIKNTEAWCMTLTKNLSLDKLRLKHNKSKNIEEAHTLSDSKPTPYTETETNDMVEKVRKLMNQLPEKQKMVMHLRDIEGLSYEEIAENLEMPMPQVKVNLFRARNSIREKITNE
jgi:RNA polymerase sigma factor (sigma-70 family)